MKLEQYLDTEKLHKHIAAGLIERKRHPTLPLHILTYTRKAMFSQTWDDVTMKCRGLIVNGFGDIVARPFEKFFDVNTFSRPETFLENLPNSTPICLEKLNGNLGILYQYPVKPTSELDPTSVTEVVFATGIASKGSFTSPHATWATEWYHAHCSNPIWPEGYTPVFEMICESIQPHAVCYGGVDKLVLLALISNETGAELDYNTLYHYAYLNGIEVVQIYAKSLQEVLGEDRANAEGYVLAWPRGDGLPPIHVRVKHERFLKLRKVFYAAKPKAILEALKRGDIPTLEEWQGTSFGANVTKWIATFSGMYGEVRLKAVTIAGHAGRTYANLSDAVCFIKAEAPTEIVPIVFAIVNGKESTEINRLIWKAVETRFADKLNSDCSEGNPCVEVGENYVAYETERKGEDGCTE